MQASEIREDDCGKGPGDAARPVGYRRSAGSARGEVRRRELLDRVVDDLAVNGLVDFSLRRAARAARTTHKVLLYYFDSVDDLLTQAIHQLRERRVESGLAAAAGPDRRTLADRVRAVWLALTGERSRVLDQAIGLMMYDPQRYGELGRGASREYLPGLLSILPPDWSDRRKVEVAAWFTFFMSRKMIRFASGDTECAAWHYPGTNGACVIMAGGFAVTKEPGTDRFASRFHDAGFSVLAFDYRRIGDSGGRPRQVLSIRDQLADWEAAIARAATLPGVDPAHLAIWGFSVSGGHILRVAARNPRLAAAIAQTPNVDGPATTRNAARYQKPFALLRLTGRGVLDALGGLVGRPPLLVPLAGAPGTVAVVTTPDGREGAEALNPGNRYPQWRQAVAARSVLPLGFYRPGRAARRVRCPLLVVVCDDDRSAPPAPAIRAARRAPHGKVVRIPGGHYAPFLASHERVVDTELVFLRKHLLGADHGAVPSRPPRGHPVSGRRSSPA